MSWPLASHFSAVLQNPRVAFRDPHLQQCTVEKDERRQPRPWAGAFAVVYKAMDPSGLNPFAVRVFTTESPERRERYEQISAYLQHRKLKCLCEFEYRDQSIRSAGDGKWYPMIVMQWVQGTTLFKWARSRCLEHDSAALADAANRWVELVNELAQACVTHGDLQHANVMVADNGDLKLVDYDCMCVPALVGRRNLEVGVEPYQHPNRNDRTLLSLDLDNFSSLLIYVALRALAADPALWQKYVEQPGYDKLLFRPEDFQFPNDSPLYRDLVQSPQQDVRELAAHLFRLVRAPMDQVPPLGSLTNSYAKIEELLMGRQWAAAVDALNRRGQFRDAPDRLKPLIRQAYEDVCRQQAWKAFRKLAPKTSEQNDRELVHAWNENLFAGYEPAERQRVRVAEARRRVELLDRLNYLAQQASQRVTLAGERSLVEAAARLPEGYHFGLEPRVEQARRRVGAVTRLEKLLANPVSEAAIVAAWRAVTEAQCDGLVDAVDAGWRPRVELAQRRAPVLKLLHEIPGELPADQRDRRLLEAWRDDLLADCLEADRWRPGYQQAIARRKTFERLEEAAGRKDEAAVARLLAEPCLAGYPLPSGVEAIAQQARARTGRADALEAVLREGRRSQFHELFDAQVIRSQAERFAPYQSVLTEWVSAEILPLEKLGLRSMGDRSLVPARLSAGSYRVRWTWPEPRFTDQCLLAVCRDEPGAADLPMDLAALHRTSIDRQSWQSGGGSQQLHCEADWADSCVVVWAVVDLGFRAFYSPPLVLGQLRSPSHWKWFGS